MPAWAGRWAGGRYYLDDRGLPVFFIESNRAGVPRSIQLTTYDEDLAKSQLVAFRNDPRSFLKSVAPAPNPVSPSAIHITQERLTLYMESIRHTVVDHQKARRSYLKAWADLRLDLRTVDRRELRLALATFDGGHQGRVEALNAFARFLVREGDLPSWNPLVNTKDPKPTRAERVAYDLADLRTAYAKITDQSIKDLLYLRVATGMHHTEIAQIEDTRVFDGLLPDKDRGIRALGGDHEIQGVIQVMHKNQHRHRQPVNAAGLRAALRLRERVPSRFETWNALTPLGVVPSNLRHTYGTLTQEMGRFVTYKGAGVSRADVAQALGHRAGSTMLADRYEKVQVPRMLVLPLEDWDVL